jgi:serine/threonine-protein kinase
VLIDGRYVVESEVGRGSMGVVYRARDVLLDRPVALKVISPEFARNAVFVSRFRREAGALAAIRNDHVVSVYTMSMHDGAYFYAMEFIEGRNLDAVVRDHEAHGTHVPVYRALTILRQVALGLAAVHARGLLHRDVKPANVVIEDRTGRPVLLDFGLARAVSAEAIRATVAAGTPPYMAPEQIAPDESDAPITPRADLYSLGCAAFEVLTGAPPFVGDGVYAVLHGHLHEAPPLLSSRRAELAPLDPVIARALAKNPADRYPDAHAFAAALEEAALAWRSLGTPLPPPLTSPPDDPPARVVAGQRRLRVLVVDDEPMFCRIASTAARLALPGGAEVIEANSGIRALTSCVAHPPDLVVLDYDMPGPDGIDTLSELRALPGAAHAVVLVVSANVGEAERWRFDALGVRDFLAKPVAFTELVDTLRRIGSTIPTVIAPTAPGDPPPSVSPVAPSEGRLPFEVFMALLGVGWADGRLDEAEREVVLLAAREEGLSAHEMDALRLATGARVELADVDVSRLRRHERAYVYAIARWIAVLDGRLTERESAALRVLGFVLTMTQEFQSSVDTLVAEVLAARDPDAAPSEVAMALRRGVRARWGLDARPPSPVS